MKRARSLLGALAALAVIGGTMFVAAPPAVAATLNVGPGGFSTIQAAVTAANPGDTIIVQPKATPYFESVVIHKSIKIHGAPNKPNPVVDGTGVAGGCAADGPFGELDGFCVSPAGGAFSLPAVQNVEIDHFTIQNFPATGILAVTTVGLNFHDNTVIDAAEYGIARFNSSQTQIVNNTVSGAEEAGIYVGDSPNASALVRLNNVSGNGFGIFLRDSSHGTVSENTANGNCIGILLIDTGDLGQTFDWVLVHNTASNSISCGGPSGFGIAAAGANHARLTANTANGNASAGIVILDGAFAGGPPPSYVQVDNNTATGNGPPDLYWDSSGNHIVFFSNTCGTSSPGGLC